MRDIGLLFENDFRVLKNVSMKDYTSFKIGGPASILLFADDDASLISAINLCLQNEIPFYVIGNGSNLLIADEGFCGVIIKINMQQLKVNDVYITAGAGTNLSRLSRIALDNELSGMEFASGIPGSLGGAICMNAGAYGSEMKDILISGSVFDLKTQTIKQFSNHDFKFEYRNSIVNEQLILTNAILKLNHGIKSEIKQRIIEYGMKRKKSQPLNFPNAGSIFKRPKDNFAGKLIMDAGLSGYCIGDAMVSPKHCGFIVNKGNATAKDVLSLINFIRDAVIRKFNIELECEIKILSNINIFH